MITKDDIIKKAHEFGFEDVGFTNADSFDSQKDVLEERKDAYAWVISAGLDLVAGTDPKTILKDAKTIIVLMELYFREAFPKKLETNFGRCYLDDDRITHVDLSKRIQAFLTYLQDNDINSNVPFHLPHRLSAARAGMGTFGKNCLFYSSRIAGQSSWVLPIAIVIDQDFEPDTPTMEVGCPKWCKNACLAACPTGALIGPRHLNPKKCISYLTYYGEGLTPLELREPMGLWVYGCDCCQNVCPRNRAWLARELTPNKRVEAKIDAFKLPRLLHMDKAYFEKKIWPHMFYMSSNDLWRWKMNVARAMGNSLDPVYVSDLIQAFGENEDERVKGMIAWALGRIGSQSALDALDAFNKMSKGLVQQEILQALEGKAG